MKEQIKLIFLGNDDRRSSEVASASAPKTKFGTDDIPSDTPYQTDPPLRSH